MLFLALVCLSSLYRFACLSLLDLTEYDGLLFMLTEAINLLSYLAE